MQHNQYYVIASAVKNAKKKKTTVPKKPLFITQIHWVNQQVHFFCCCCTCRIVLQQDLESGFETKISQNSLPNSKQHFTYLTTISVIQGMRICQSCKFFRVGLNAQLKTVCGSALAPWYVDQIHTDTQKIDKDNCHTDLWPRCIWPYLQ